MTPPDVTRITDQPSSLIRIERVSRWFETRSGSVHAVDGFDLEVADGELVTIVGRSGCGKSTLLRMIAGLLPATEGSIAIAGDAVNGPRRDVALMFQRSALLPWRNVLANVMLPIDVARGDRAAARRDALEQADFSLVWPVSDRWRIIGRYSYSLLDEERLEDFFGWEYEACCWRLRMVNRNYVARTGETDSSISLQLELKGLSQRVTAPDDLLDRGILGYRDIAGAY